MDVKHHVYFKHSFSAGVKGVGIQILLGGVTLCYKGASAVNKDGVQCTAHTLREPLSSTFLQTLPTEGALFISAQLSTDAVSALRKVRVLI